MWIGGQNAGLGLFNLILNDSELVSLGERLICVKGESILPDPDQILQILL